MDIQILSLTVAPICALIAYMFRRLGRVEVLEAQQKSLTERLDRLEYAIERLDGKLDAVFVKLLEQISHLPSRRS